MANKRHKPEEIVTKLRQVGPDELRALVPSVSPCYSHGLYSPAFQHALDPQGLIARLAVLFSARGGAWFHEEVRGIDTQGRRVSGVVAAKVSSRVTAFWSSAAPARRSLPRRWARRCRIRQSAAIMSC